MDSTSAVSRGRDRGSVPAAAQLFLRVALAAGFLSPVADRFGLWGPPGTPNVGWGNWAQFSAYAHQLMFFLPTGVAEILAIAATGAELLFGALLLIGLGTRWVALGSGLLLLSFAGCMTLALGVHAPLNYSVFGVAAASFLLATMREYRFSLDAWRQARPGEERRVA